MKNYIVTISLLTSTVLFCAEPPLYATIRDPGNILERKLKSDKEVGIALASAAGAIRNTGRIWSDAQKDGSCFAFPHKDRSSNIGLMLYPYQLAGKRNFLKSAINSFLGLFRIGTAVPVALVEVHYRVVAAALPGQQPQIVCHKNTKRCAMLLSAAAAGYFAYNKYR